ncbi:BadF/BadG/BcrA/BcrD ATPase family protein [Actinomycetes bacterium KLBMP 9797]
MSDTLVIGLDVGATSTRALVASLTGDRLGTGRAGGGNPTAHGAEHAAAQLATALGEALAGVDPALVRAGTIGLAGGGRLRADPAGQAAFDRAWRGAGLRCPYAVVGDALVAYAAGTASPDGTVVIAGTGAIACDVRDLALDRIADGHGWVLGDLGSGFWLGREAVRRTLHDLDAGRQPGPLGRAVLVDLLGSAAVAARPRATVDTVVQVVTRRSPVELARLAPLVIDAYPADPAAAAIVAAAAAHLADSVSRVRPAGASSPVVRGGGLLTADTPLAAALGAALAERWPDAPLPVAGDGAAAAAWLAARPLLDPSAAPSLHATLLP